jgi:hypothetical protein
MVALELSKRKPGDRVSFICAVKLRVRPSVGKDRTRAIFRRSPVGNRLGDRAVAPGAAICSGNGETCKRLATGK